jgi:hypothetical protein
MTKRFLLGAGMTLCLMMAVVSVHGSGADGRWKLGDDGSCTFDPTDSGPDQCDPTVGRWKLGDDGSCTFDQNDTGPDQCQPAQTPAPTVTQDGQRSSEVTAVELPVSGPDKRGARAEQHREIEPLRSVAGHDR